MFDEIRTPESDPNLGQTPQSRHRFAGDLTFDPIVLRKPG